MVAINVTPSTSSQHVKKRLNQVWCTTSIQVQKYVIEYPSKPQGKDFLALSHFVYSDSWMFRLSNHCLKEVKVLHRI